MGGKECIWLRQNQPETGPWRRSNNRVSGGSVRDEFLSFPIRPIQLSLESNFIFILLISASIAPVIAKEKEGGAVNNDQKNGPSAPHTSKAPEIPLDAYFSLMRWPLFGALVAFGLFRLTIFMGDQAYLLVDRKSLPNIPTVALSPDLEIFTDLSYLAAGAGLSLVVSVIYLMVAAGILFLTIRTGLSALVDGQVDWRLSMTWAGVLLAGPIIVVLSDSSGEYHASDLIESIVDLIFRNPDISKFDSHHFEISVRENILRPSIAVNYIAFLSIALAAGGVLFRAEQRRDTESEAQQALSEEETQSPTSIELKKREIAENRATGDLQLLSILMVGGAIVFFCQLAVLNIWYGMGLHFMAEGDARESFGNLLDASLIYWSVAVIGAVLGTYCVLYVASCRIVGVSPVKHLPLSRADIPKVLALLSPLLPSLLTGLSDFLTNLPSLLGQ